MKKLLLILALLVLAGGVVGIIAGAEDQSAAPEAPPAQSDAPPATAQPQSARGSVYYLNFKPEQAAQWEQLGKTYQDKTGVNVTVVTAASGSYESTLRSEMEKAAAPTLFQVNGPIGLKIWKDYCLDLTDTALYENLKSDEFALREDGKVLAVAYVVETYGILYNKELFAKYLETENAAVTDAAEIDGFAKLKAVADDLQKKKDELGIQGAFTSAGMDSSSDWRFKTHLANLPVYYEYKERDIPSTDAIQGLYLEGFKRIFDLYITDSVCAPALLGARTMEDSTAEFTLGEAVFYQNGTWAYGECIDAGMTDEQLGMLPIYIGAEGEEAQGLCTGSENYWCLNRRAKEEDIAATKAFVEWVVTSDEGRDMLANQMGFVTPFRTFDESYAAKNALLRDAERSLAEGKVPVAWTFTTMPSERWKDGVGAALLEYAQGTADWGAVETAFVDGWKREYEASNQS